MGLYRDEEGRLIDVDDRFAAARGYSPVGVEEGFGGELTREVDAARGEDRGVVGDINAALTGVASGLTLGGSDYLLGETLTPLERQRLQAELEAHPTLRMGGEMAGALIGGMAMPGSAAARTPAGYLGSRAAMQVEQGLAQGGIKGTARALGSMGAEGALQSAGQYIGHSAIADKEVTAEGLAGSLGTGFAFGAAGGGAMLGVAKGTMAARRMFSRAMDGERAAKQAESAWTIARQEALDGDAATARAAEIKLEEIRKAKMEAMRSRNEARAMSREEQMRAATFEGRAAVADDGTIIAPEAPMGPEPLIDVGPQTGPGGVTSKFQRPNVEFDPNAARSFDEGLPAARDQINDVAGTIKKPETGAKTGAFKRPDGSTKRIATGAADEATDLERQLAGTKSKLDEGMPLKDIEGEPVKASKGNESDSIEKWLVEEKVARAKARTNETLSEMRYAATEDLLGAPMAKMEREIAEAMDEFTAARKDLEELSDGVPEPLWDSFTDPTWPPAPPGLGRTVEDRLAFRQRHADWKKAQKAPPVDAPAKKGGTVAGSPGRRKAVEILDDAHEEALLRAKYGADPQEAGKAISEAAELERLLDDVSDGIPRHYADDALGAELLPDIEKLWRYEQASAKLADVLGDQAHMTSVARAKALRDAERDSARKVMDRSARAVDDAEQFGPAYKTPKERVQYARERVSDAQKNLDELGVQEREARDAFNKAGKKLRENERVKKGVLREEAAAARGANKVGAQDAGGILEIVDLPGIPKPSDLPIIGPLLGAWLKFRTLKRAMGRMGGRVPATADAQVAARAAQTRDRIARAVDRSLGLAEKTGKYASRKMPAAAGILSARIFDDGGEDPGPKAPIQKQATARMRELYAYVSTPMAIELDVRRQLRGVTDPDLIASAEKHRRFMMEYILKHAPKVPDQGLLKTHDWEMSAGQAMSLARCMEAANDPPAVFEKMAQDDTVSLEASETVREVYPRLFQEALRRATERAAEAPGKIPIRTRIQMSLFYKMPFEPALEPENFAITQSVYERKPSSPGYNPQAPGAAAPAGPTVQPSVAQPTDLSQAYMPSFDRR